MPPRDRLTVVVALVAVGLFCSFWVALPPRDVVLHGFSYTLTSKMLLGVVLLGLTCAGVEDVVRRHPKIESQPQSRSLLCWILPAALIVVSYAVLSRLTGIETVVVGVLVASMTFSLLVIAEYYALDATGRWHTVIQFSLHLVTYLLAMLLYTVVHLHVPAEVPTAIIVAVVSAILGLRVLCAQQCPLERGCLYVLGLGALLGVGSWVLSPCKVSPLSYSLALTVLLYVLSGAVRQLLLGKLTREVALEYVLAGGLILLLLLSYAR